MKNVHIVPHMHWDREWYFSTEESRILLVNNMEEIFEKLEKEKDYPYYVLDGQTAIIEDYLAVKPENEERLRRLVQAGKIIVGPWYSQTDEMVVGAESITRNLLYGIKDSKKFGNPMMIGYLPDSFGQSAQLPKILNGFKIDKAMFWRGTSERHGTNKTEFIWNTEPNYKVTTQLLPLGYAIGKYLPTEKNALSKRMEKYLPVLDRGATGEHILLPNGHDQMPVQKNIHEVINSLHELYPERKFFLSNYDNLFEEIMKNTLPEISGEFIDGKYMRVHRSIFSTRMDIKSINARIENKITNVLEPLATIAYNLGFEYQHGLIELIWKEIMKNHAHDSIGCCCSDKVHREILNRFYLAEEKTDQLINFYKRKITDAIKNESQDDLLTLFNLSLESKTEVITTDVITKMENFIIQDFKGNTVNYDLIQKEIIDPGLIDRQIVHYGDYEPFYKYTIQLIETIPAMGYKAFKIVNENKDISNIKETTNLTTQYFDIEINKNGTINILDKEFNELYTNVLALENVGDDGDEYDFSPLENERFELEQKLLSSNIYETSNEYKIVLKVSLDLPVDLESRKTDGETVENLVLITLTLGKLDRNINIKINIDNKSKDHRLRMLFPTNVNNKFSFSDNQFGEIKRSVIDDAINVWEKEDWDERPDTIYPFLSYVSSKQDDKNVTVISNSTREYQFVGESFEDIAITLFRSIGVLGKENLVRRPGRPSGIKMPTPDSQMLREIELELNLLINYENSIPKKSKSVLTPLHCYNKIPHNAMKLNKDDISLENTFSLFEINSEVVVLSTVKKAENKDAILIRIFNPSENIEVINFEDIFGATVSIVNLNEETIKEQVSEVHFNPNEVITIKTNSRLS
ncbi:glycoside hydrolase family 38 C-terminal domain-containing protein [Macrococcus sp. EM39E]|uniref:glycoside hydrolase family 38 N-terminal domain-containing protein n=1 Tax=Macrococcus animalis TaxID=3395467 RepID=UPI0039BEBCFF